MKTGLIVTLAIFAGIVGAGMLWFLAFNGTLDRIGIGVLKSHQNTGTENFVMLDSGGSHTCGLREDGEVLCWGYMDDKFVLPDEPLASFSTSETHLCGLKDDGSAVCWGADDEDQSSPPAGERFSSVSVAKLRSCGVLLSGELFCWGSSAGGFLDAPVGSNFVAVSVGNRYSCALDMAGQTHCWSEIWKDEHRPYYESTHIALPSEESRFFSVMVSRMAIRACGIRVPDADVPCWGARSNQYWGLMSEDLFVIDGQFSAVSLSFRIPSLVSAAGRIVSFGRANVKCGFDESCDVPVPSAEVSSIVMGHEHACGLRHDGRAVCWTWKERDGANSRYIAVP